MPREATPSDRVQLISRGQLLHPGSCALCGSGNCDDGYIDTGIYYDYEGQVYFCMACMEQIAGAAGYFSPGEVAFIQDQLKSAVQDLTYHSIQLEEANERLGKYDSLFANVLQQSAFDPSLIAPVGTEPAILGKALTESSEVPAAGESVVAEPVTIKRPTNSAQSSGSNVSRKSDRPVGGIDL